MIVAPINSQVSLNVVATPVTIVTNITGGTTQITNMIITNTNATTARTVTILVKGTASAVGKFTNCNAIPLLSSAIQIFLCLCFKFMSGSFRKATGS